MEDSSVSRRAHPVAILAFVLTFAAGPSSAGAATQPGESSAADSSVQAVRSSSPLSWPIVPTIDAASKARLRGVFQLGPARGNHADVFAKVGDSITASDAFAVGLGCGHADLDGHDALAPVIDYFARRTFPDLPGTPGCGDTNSFTRRSVAAVIGWSAKSAVEPSSSAPDPSCPMPTDPLACELRLLHPSIAVVMFGTNDMDRYGDDTTAFAASLRAIARRAVAAGTIPVLSTIPPRPQAGLDERVLRYNEAVIQVARTERVPLWNYWLALARPGMVSSGISGDGVHPNQHGGCSPGCASVDFSPDGLRYGFDQRNFTLLQVLAKLRSVVLSNRAPDPSAVVAVMDTRVAPTIVSASLGAAVRFDLDAANTLKHTVTDATGLGLYDSGPMAAGSSFRFGFAAAGTYPFRCTLHPAMGGTVRVPVEVTPGVGDEGTLFTVRWASVPPPTGFVIDVQARRPGRPWTNWRTGQTATVGTFVVDGGPGRYAFRAKLRHVGGGAPSGFSPGARVNVA